MSERRGPKSPLDHDPQSVTEAREERGLTKTALARKVGVTLSLISEIEKGTRNAHPEMIRRLAKALRVPAYRLKRKSAMAHVDQDLMLPARGEAGKPAA